MTTTATMTAANKLAATLADIQTNGAKTLGQINKILRTVYPPESLTRSAIHTAQTLREAGITTEQATMSTMLDNEYSNGLKLADSLQKQAISYLVKESRKHEAQVNEWQAELLEAAGASVEWSNVYGHYEPRTGNLLYYVPTFRAYAADGSHILEYYIVNGKLSICG